MKALISPVQYKHADGQFIEVNGKKIWVEIEGSGIPIILLAGGPAASHLTFHPYFSALADTFQVIYYDYFGRGNSGRPASYSSITFEEDLKDLYALMNSLQIDKAVLYGFSYGGMVAQGFSLAHPERVSHLILANSLHSPEMWQKNHDNINKIIEFQYPELWESIQQLKKEGYLSSSPDMRNLYMQAATLIRFYNPDNAARMLKDSVSFNVELYYTYAGPNIEFVIGNEVARLPDFRPRLKELNMPLLILAGRFDRALYPKYQMEFKQYAPQARFVMMEKSGSFAHIEEPEMVMELIREFTR